MNLERFMFYVNELQWEAEMEEARRYYHSLLPSSPVFTPKPKRFYNPNTRCPKCHASPWQLTTKHVHATNYMHRTCQQCGAWWEELPLDAPAPQETDDEGFTGKCPTCGQEYHPNQEN